MCLTLCVIHRKYLYKNREHLKCKGYRRAYQKVWKVKVNVQHPNQEDVGMGFCHSPSHTSGKEQEAACENKFSECF